MLQNLTKFQKLVYIVIFVLAILASLWGVFFRLFAEFENKTVELVMDFQDVDKIHLHDGIPRETVLQTLLETGLKTLVINEDTIPSLSDQGMVTWIGGQSILDHMRLGVSHSYFFSYFLHTNKIQAGYSYLMISEYGIYENANRFLKMEMGSHRVSEAGKDILEVLYLDEDLESLGLGFSEFMMKNLQKRGFSVILRPFNSKNLSDENFRRKLTYYSEFGDVKTIICAGKEALGYPKRYAMAKKFMKETGLNLGLIELSEQKGAANLSERIPGQVIRVHSIPEDEMETIAPEKAIKRFMRAVVERGARILYVRPILQPDLGPDYLSLNEEYINNLVSKLESKRFRVGQIEKICVRKKDELLHS